MPVLVSNFIPNDYSIYSPCFGKISLLCKHWNNFESPYLDCFLRILIIYCVSRIMINFFSDKLNSDGNHHFERIRTSTVICGCIQDDVLRNCRMKFLYVHFAKVWDIAYDATIPTRKSMK